MSNTSDEGTFSEWEVVRKEVIEFFQISFEVMRQSVLLIPFEFFRLETLLLSFL